MNLAPNTHGSSNEEQVTGLLREPVVGQPFKKADVVSCPGCKQRLRLPQQVACYVIKCSGCGFAVTPQQALTSSGRKGTAESMYATAPRYSALLAPDPSSFDETDCSVVSLFVCLVVL